MRLASPYFFISILITCLSSSSRANTNTEELLHRLGRRPSVGVYYLNVFSDRFFLNPFRKPFSSMDPVKMKDRTSLPVSGVKEFWDGNTKYKFENIEIKGSTAKVPTKFFVKGEPFMLEYFFSKKGDQWLIYDISYEDVRYSTNISEQIDAFLKEGNFATLLDKLRKRRDELSEETAKPAKKA